MLKEGFLIRPMQSSTDLIRIINRFSFPWSTPEKTQAIWETYHQEQEEGTRTVFVIENQNEILGYGSLLRKSENPTFNRSNIPEVNAIWTTEYPGCHRAICEWPRKIVHTLDCLR